MTQAMAMGRNSLVEKRPSVSATPTRNVAKMASAIGLIQRWRQSPSGKRSSASAKNRNRNRSIRAGQLVAEAKSMLLLTVHSRNAIDNMAATGSRVRRRNRIADTASSTADFANRGSRIAVGTETGPTQVKITAAMAAASNAHHVAR